MKTKLETIIDLDRLVYLPSFAQYLLENKLDEFVEMQIRMVFEMDIPFLKHVKKLSPEELSRSAKQSAADLLGYLIRNEAKKQIAHANALWKENQLPLFQKNEISAEDITGISHLRKQAFVNFIPGYTNDIEETLGLIKELDQFISESQITSVNTYINILRENIYEDALLIGKVKDTLPGALYIFDLEHFHNVSSNSKLAEIIGYDPNELNEMGSASIAALLHPDDQLGLKEHLLRLQEAKDGEVKSIKYRVKDKSGNYKWLANHESVYRRNSAGKAIQTIGITLDIDSEQRALQLLQEKDRLHRTAEAVAHVGSYVSDPETMDITWSEELYRIHEMEPSTSVMNYYRDIEKFLVERDREMTRQTIATALEKREPFDFHYRIQVNGKEKILHARGQLMNIGANGEELIMGTVQDVTEKQALIQRLRRTESVYKQAEELANMGNWSWDLETDKVEWTDQLYRIYGLPPQSETITIEKFYSFIHPEDRPQVQEASRNLAGNAIQDYTFRIITPAREVKILRSVAQVQYDAEGKAVMIIGTERDVTEKQTLINQFRESEKLYKQAQNLAHVGNWSWDVESNVVEWSDELFRMYGLEPQSQSLSYSDYLSFIHPSDLDRVSAQIEKALTGHEPWEFTHRLIRKDGTVRIVFATGEVTTDPSGAPKKIFGTVQDITERQTLIDRLQESEKLYKQAQAMARIGNWSLDLATNKFEWSDEMYRIYEIENREEFSLDSWITFIHPEEREAVTKYYQECLRELKPYDRVQRVKLLSGQVKTIHRKGEFELDTTGKAVRMVGTTQDITEEYDVQRELEENQNFIRKITDAAPSIISSYNVKTGDYVFVSQGFSKLLGYDTEMLMQKGASFLDDITHPDDRAASKERLAQFLEEADAHPGSNTDVFEFTSRVRHANGAYRWLHTYGTIFDRSESGAVDHLLNIAIDVSDQVMASQRIKDQEHFIQQIADASPTILYLYNVEQQSIEYINREIFFVLGYLPEEIIDAGDTITQKLYDPEDYPLLPARKESSKSFQQIDSMIQYECRMRNKAGEWRWFLVREIVFKTDENGAIRQILGAALDINRRKELEKTILQNSVLLEQSNASLEEFAYVASHDLKEPLRKISTFGDRLSATQAKVLTSEGQLYLSKIIDASQRMQTMINDLLSISMISGNHSFERTSLQTILEDTLQTLEYKIEQQNAIVKADPLPEANIVVSQFRQLFQNLLSNSLKFVKPGVQPVVTIKHQLVSASELPQYQLTQSAYYHKLEFCDNGIGFENEFAGKIFAIFQRLHGRSEYEGSGIGLAICKKIVEHHGGIIFAKGVSGEGATFTIIIPA